MKSALASESRDHPDHIVVAFAREVLRLKGTIRMGPRCCLGRAGASPNRGQLRYVCVQNEFPPRLSEERDHVALTGESGRRDHNPVELHPARTQQWPYPSMQISTREVMSDRLRLTLKAFNVLAHATPPHAST